MWGGAGAAGLVLGVLLGGVLTQAFGWEAVFFVNVPLRSPSPSRRPCVLIDVDGPREAARRFDLPGALSVTLGALTLLVFALVQGPEHGWGSPRDRRRLAVGVLLLASSRSSSGAAATRSCGRAGRQPQPRHARS